jgi:hypothetical protein
MKICWVTNEVWFSKLLRYLFNESISHAGVMTPEMTMHYMQNITKSNPLWKWNV